ncbi:hypothetical protein [Alteromonas macleodii]|uniref:Phage protein n=1 Tax=Alteromonas macleodii TaxID=28108 RepID=A0AB36FKU8_ALTMA|nr:hypothetical protein [Alteromonas macleodii]OES24498.1 putative phage protein [Alteromonas macleodii]OES25555.1 putative phage protein [Alteromonas macleodii]OES25856.1 putative phage protein [Alteromonas macleodii]OES38622.1 putative phage protein [Alteromonas macleodii]
MKNTLLDLNNHLFAQLERLGEEDLSGEKLEHEIERTKAITSVSREIVSNAALALKAEEIRAELGNGKNLPAMIEKKDDAL